MHKRHSLARIVFAMLLAFALASCSSAASTSTEPADDTHGNDLEPPAAIALVDRPSGQPTIEVLSPVDGAVVTSPVRMIVLTSGMDLRAPGSPVDGEGHWHVLIDQGCLPAGAFIPEDAQSIHVGSRSNSADIDLPIGTHELCVQIGDGFHVAINVYDTITVTVVDPPGLKVFESAQ